MNSANFLPTEAIVVALKATTKRNLLQDIADVAASQSELGAREIFDALLQRERLGSTGIGNGIAIPHAKFASLTQLKGLFFQLDKPIEFEALDGQMVDLIFVLLAPEGAGADHLKGLARVARVMRDPVTAALLRKTRDTAVIREAFQTGALPSQAA